MTASNVSFQRASGALAPISCPPNIARPDLRVFPSVVCPLPMGTCAFPYRTGRRPPIGLRVILPIASLRLLQTSAACARCPDTETADDVSVVRLDHGACVLVAFGDFGVFHAVASIPAVAFRLRSARWAARSTAAARSSAPRTAASKQAGARITCRRWCAVNRPAIDSSPKDV